MWKQVLTILATTTSVTSCSLNNLLANKLYQIQIVAVNLVNHFRSQSSPVFIETLPKPNVKEDIGNSLPVISKNSVRLSKVNFVEKTDVDTTKKNLAFDLNPKQIMEIESPEKLNNYLLIYQTELSKVKEEYEMNHKKLGEEMFKLVEDLKLHKKEHEEETGFKSRKDINVKDLEKKRDTLTFQKSKLTKQLKSYNSTKDINNSKLEDLKNKVKKLKERKSQILKYEHTDKSSIDEQISIIVDEIEVIKLEHDRIEENCKILTSEKKNLTTTLNNLKPLVESFINEVIFTREGNLTTKGGEILNKIYQMQPSWSEDITNEIYTSVNYEINWKTAFKAEIRKFLSIQHSFEIAKSNINHDYQAMKLSEHQASIEFGGFSNALPKKYKKSFSPSTVPTSPGADELGQHGNEWGNFYGQVYSNDSNDQFSNDPVAQKPQQGFPYDDNAYSNIPGSAISSPINQEPAMHTDILQHHDMLAPEMNALLMNNEPYHGFQSSTPLNNMWNTKIDSSMYINRNLAPNLQSSDSSVNFGLNNRPIDLHTPYKDLNSLQYNSDINIFNPTPASASSLNTNYFAPHNADVELNDPTATRRHTASPLNSIFSSPPPPPPQQEFPNLWLDRHSRTVSGSNSQIWRNDSALGHNHNFNLQLFSSTPSLTKNDDGLDLHLNREI